MEDPSLEPLISSVGVLSCYGTLGTTQARGKQTGSDMEHRLASPFTFASPSLTVPARTFRHTQQMQPAKRYCCLYFFASSLLLFSPPPLSEAQCIPFQRGGLEAAITSSHI